MVSKDKTSFLASSNDDYWAAKEKRLSSNIRIDLSFKNQ